MWNRRGCRPPARPGNNDNVTTELLAKATASVMRPTNCNHCRVGTTPQRVQTDCFGKNCNPQRSQNNGYLATGTSWYCPWQPGSLGGIEIGGM